MKLRRFTCWLLLAATAFAVQAQQYPFIRYQANRLQYDSATAPTMRYFLAKWHKLTTTGQGAINIVHIGGSHVQAGTLPHAVRTRLLSDYPTLVGGRGLVFPYAAAAKCNNPADYKVHCRERVILTRNVYHNPEHPLGLCGISVTAQDQPTRIQLLSNDSQFDYAVSHIEVLGHSASHVVPRLSYQSREVYPSYIDTDAHRYVFNLQQTVDSFDIVLPCGSGESFTLTGVYLGSRHPGITYHGIGVNGAAVPDYLKCCDLTSDLRLVRPDMVIFGIGINDAHGSNFDTVAFRKNYMRLCDSIRSVSPNCAFVFVTNNDCYRKVGKRKYSVNTNGLAAREVFYRLAAATGGAVWDQFDIMGGLKSMEQWQKAGLAQRDKVHFTRAGYTLLGNMLYEALAQELKNSQCYADVKIPKADRGSVRTNKRAPAADKGDPGERPLPRGLRRKSSKPQHASIQPPEGQSSNKQSSNPANQHESDRFPYISQ